MKGTVNNPQLIDQITKNTRTVGYSHEIAFNRFHEIFIKFDTFR